MLTWHSLNNRSESQTREDQRLHLDINCLVTAFPILSLTFCCKLFPEPYHVSMMVLTISSVPCPFKWQLLYSSCMWYCLLAVQDGFHRDICVDEVLLHDHVIKGCCEACRSEVIRTWKKCVFHSRVVQPCMSPNVFQPLHVAIWESSITTVAILAQVMLLIAIHVAV